MFFKKGKEKDPRTWEKNVCRTRNYKFLKNNQTELKTTITKMKNILEGINRRIIEAEEWMSELENRVGEITAAEYNKK